MNSKQFDPRDIREEDFPHHGSTGSKIRFLLQYALLAPSSHNTQPWKFSLRNEGIRILVDVERWLNIADRDQRELYISAGCALENFIIAADHYGFNYEVYYTPDSSRPDLAALVTLHAAKRKENRVNGLLKAIRMRQTNHHEFDGRPISSEDRALIQKCTEDGIHLYLTADEQILEKVDDLVVRADLQQFADPAFRQELGYWIGEGVFGASWLLAKIAKIAVSHLNLGKTVGKKDSRGIMSASLLGFLTTPRNDRESQIRTGQVFERIYLTCTTLGIGIQPVSQLVQVPEIKEDLATLIGLENQYLQQPFRLGYGKPETHWTPRRPLGEVIFIE